MSDPIPLEEARTTPGAKLLKWFSGVHLRVYRATGGVLGGVLFDPPFPWRILTMCLLTTTGRKSGIQRTLPLLYVGDGERVILIASYAGKPVHPLWFKNLMANPEAVVQTGRLVRHMTARTATPEERAVLWPRVVRVYPGYARYQKGTDREIPLVICEPRK